MSSTIADVGEIHRYLVGSRQRQQVQRPDERLMLAAFDVWRRLLPFGAPTWWRSGTASAGLGGSVAGIHYGHVIAGCLRSNDCHLARFPEQLRSIDDLDTS
jgi:hypothetical protein